MELEDWASLSTQNRDWLNQFKNTEWVKFHLRQLNEINIQEYYSDFQRRLKDHEAKTAPVTRLWQNKYTAAAAIIFTILIAPYLYKTALTRDAVITPTVVHSSTNSKPAPKIVHRPKNDATMQFASNAGPMAINIIGPRQAAHFIQNEERSVLKDHSLPDGSIITLNAASTIKYPGMFDGNKRRIELNGEAFVEATRADSFPFLMVANNIHIETAGGKFNVRAYQSEEQTQITALNGNKLTVAAGPYQTTVQPGQTAVVTKGSPIEVYNSSDTNAITAYTKVMFHFNNVDLNTLVTELGRWYGLTVIGSDSCDTRVSFVCSRQLNITDVLKNLIGCCGNKRHLTLIDDRLIFQ
jgi:hypothetical protein